MNPDKHRNVDEYISKFPAETQALLEEVRDTIRKAAPEAQETISYQMPAYKQNGILVYFAGYKNHIGFYPTASGIEAFQDEISGYKSSKGAVQFPIDKPMPLDLITRMVRFRIEKDREKTKAKARTMKA